MASLDPMPDHIVLLFVRAPIKGRVKTRLGTILSHELAHALYQCFVLDVIRAVRQSGYSMRICFHPPQDLETMVDWLGTTLNLLPQIGLNLGQRMANAFSDAFSDGFQQVILMGSDIPQVSPEIITEAFEALRTKDAVVGPALDGGYYLLGFCKDAFSDEIFKDMPWGSSKVLTKTLAILHNQSTDFYLLPLLRDIDAYEDLLDFIKSNERGRFPGAALHTMALLSKIGWSNPNQRRF